MVQLLIGLSHSQGPDPSTWGKADQATMQRRKVVRVRRGGAAAEPASTAAAAQDSEKAGAANPFAGVSLAAAEAPAANPFAGVSLMAAAKVKPSAPQQRVQCCSEGTYQLYCLC